MYRTAALMLVVVAILLSGCANDENKHMMNGDHGSMQNGKMAGSSTAATLPAGANKVCPVSGDPVDPTVYVDYKGKRVYFCCDDCPAKFKQAPEEYFAKAYPDAAK
jgi:YHS domain-containing protein